MQAEEGGFLRDAGADLADADDAEGFAGQQRGALAGEQNEGGGDVFSNGVGVAARRGTPGNAGVVQPRDFEMIGAGGGGGDEFDRCVFEQGGPDNRLGAHDQGLGVAQMLAADVTVREDFDFAEAGEGFAGEQDAGGADDFHGAGAPAPAGRRSGRAGFTSWLRAGRVPR